MRPTDTASEPRGLRALRARSRQLRASLPGPLAALLELAVMVVVALALAEGVQAAVVKPFKIPSGSMEPTLEIGQRVLVNRLIFDFRSPHRGEVVVFHPPASLACPAKASAYEPCPRGDSHPSGSYFVKRVMGLPGERISIRAGHPVIDGRELTREPYIKACGEAPECNMPDTITIPPGHYFMMGDNRGDSDDSRYWGPVPASWIVGPVFLTYWPPDRIGGP
ncbi:MAG TPA: signal peptidase I [Solirubrobacteraceae bacterium]|nr:signal peptidase I [Solirubrobacteraceae bacterium]